MIVTVVTPTLNARQYLGECIKSAKKNNSCIVEVEHMRGERVEERGERR